MALCIRYSSATPPCTIALAIIDLTLEKFFLKPPSLFFRFASPFFLAQTFQTTSGTNSPLPVANPTPSSDFPSPSTSKGPFFIHFGSLFLPREKLQDIFSLLATSSPHTHLSWGTSSLLSLVMMAASSTATAVLVQPGYERATSRRECRARFEAVPTVSGLTDLLGYSSACFSCTVGNSNNAGVVVSGVA